MKNILPIIACIFVMGCASAYKPPQTAVQDVMISVSGNKQEVFKKSMNALLHEGYSIASSNESVGFISTARRQMPLSPADVDVGTTMGIDYMKDKRTTVFVTITIQVQDAKATIRSDIDAEYLPNDPVYGKRMKGVSKGTVEKQISSAIQSN